MKKLNVLILLFVLAFTVAFTACEYEVDEGIRSNKELVYTLCGEGEDQYYIVGKTMELSSVGLTKAAADALDYEQKAIQLGVYGGVEKKITVPAEYNGLPVKGIGAYAFYLCDAEEVVLPETVERISESAFAYCADLKRVTVGSFEKGSALTSIGANAFARSTRLSVVSLWSVTCPEVGDLEAVNSLGVFYGTSYPVVLVPAQNETAYKADGEWSVYGDYVAASSSEYSDGQIVENDVLIKYAGGDAEVTVIDGVTKIGNYAFKNTAVETVNIAASVKEIGRQAFGNCKALSGVVFSGESSLEIIGNNAFEECISLRTAIIPAKVKTVKDRVFTGCAALDTVYINSTYFTLCTEVFRKCTALKDVYFIGTEEQFKALDVLGGNQEFLALGVTYDYLNVPEEALPEGPSIEEGGEPDGEPSTAN